MTTVGVNRKAALSFLSNLSNFNDNKSNGSNSEQDESTTQEADGDFKQKRNNIELSWDLPPDPDLEEDEIRIPRPPSSPKNPPKQMRKPLRSKRDKAATLFLSSIGSHDGDKEEGITIVTSPISISDNKNNTDNNNDNYFIPTLERKLSKANSELLNNSYDSSSSSDDDINQVSRVGSYTDEDINILATSKRSSYLSDRSILKDLASTISTNIEPVFAEVCIIEIIMLKLTFL
ncbi:hypothetical protein K502DRAFT_245654 [Neoconidiobolus thromboides FSU 785]|nr:hypothetical protein K502DRAFT_245654 [Neoconidiobolus thromboides FSU 785]